MGYSQEGSLSNLHERIILEPKGRQLLDSLTIASSSVQVFPLAGGIALDSRFYHIADRYIEWQQPPGFPVKVRYRVLPFHLGAVAIHLDTSKVEKNTEEGVIGFEYNPYEKETPLLGFRGLNYSGSFSRGLSFGNNQDLVLNSRFNLQLAGKLGDDIEILAAITDENIPIQAEGNTRQLQEFDKIFIQLSKGNSRLIAGDYELARPSGYFMNYFKKLQGATFSNEWQMTEKAKLNTQASVAVSRGQFARNQLSAIEGNQGPYKLQGSQGERFIIILSGTEKVYLDGQLLLRGLEDDYTIDYNQGEITFTSRRLVTKDSRIIVEFEYSDQRYLRSLYAFNANYQREKLDLYFNVFSQQDSRNSTGDLDLSDEQKKILSEAGDDPARAILPSLDTLDAFSPERVSYKLVDTLVSCSGLDTLVQYLSYSTNPDSAIYVASFSLVGLGNGDYVLDASEIGNERIYRWIAPDPLTCEHRGSYAPIIQLATPQQQQLYTVGLNYRFSKNSGWRTEVAMSHFDNNRFSKLDKADDNGLAAYTSYFKRFQLGSDSSGWALNTSLSAEWVEDNFKPLNPYRSTEFVRDWNLTNIQGVGESQKSSEQLGRASIGISKEGWGSLDYALSGFQRSDFYQGLRHSGALTFSRKGWLINGAGSLLQTEEPDRRTQFLRPKLNASKKIGNWRLGVEGQLEKSDRYDLATDSLQASSFYFDRYRFFIEKLAGETFGFGTGFSQRTDFVPVGNDYFRSTIATEIDVNSQWKIRRSFQLNGNVTYRQLEVLRSNIGQDPAETFLGRVDLNYNPVKLKGAIRSNSSYEIGSGQEPKLEFTYKEVPAGSGTHIWLDSLYNNDGKIQPNEMEIAPFPDQANYIPIRTFTDEFIRTDNVSFNQILELNPKSLWYGKKGLKKWLSRFSTRSTLKITRKTQESEEVQAWNPFQLNIADTSLVSITSNIRNTLFFNRQNNDALKFQLGQEDNRNRIVQTSGYESRRITQYLLETRLNFGQTWSLQLDLKLGEKENDSELFDTKDYLLEFIELGPELAFQPSKSFRTLVKYAFRQDENTGIEMGELATQNNFSLESTFNSTAKSSLRLRFSYIAVKFQGEANSPVGFAILNGLQKGKNYLWNLSLNRRLGNNIQLNLTYEGRKTGTANVIHTGRAQVTAVF
ncbi:MAG: hypothetical protein DHS20C18_53220 [Saprospiraceae bacterium]|nr:MAG: hypothetical protein DHS20C18_53220 [Saprospiraceae bacterium]